MEPADLDSLVMVVEDDRIQRMMLTDLLEDRSMHVLQCDSAEAAEQLFEQIGSDIELLITDVQLAGDMSGVELARIAKARFPSLKIVVVSGRPQQDLPAGVTFLSKPYRPLDILREAVA